MLSKHSPLLVNVKEVLVMVVVAVQVPNSQICVVNSCDTTVTPPTHEKSVGAIVQSVEMVTHTPDGETVT